MAEYLLRDALAVKGVPAEIRSSGSVTEDRPASNEVIELLAERGIDGSAHRSQLTTPALVDWADLILVMATEHLRNTAVLTPGAFSRTFLVKELAAASSRHGRRRADESLADYLARVGEGRSPQAYLRDDPSLEVEDPIGRRMKVYRSVTEELVGLTNRLVNDLWPGHAGQVPAVAG